MISQFAIYNLWVQRYKNYRKKASILPKKFAHLENYPYFCTKIVDYS